MDKFEVVERLKRVVAEVRFTKVNGEFRQMNATLNSQMMPEAVAEVEQKAPRKKNDQTLSVWDTDKQDWRSFRWDLLQDVDGVPFDG